MSWNYRVVKSGSRNKSFYAIHEAYYKDGLELPHSITATPVFIKSDTIAELKSDIERFDEALTKPVLEVVNGVIREVKNQGTKEDKIGKASNA